MTQILAFGHSVTYGKGDTEGGWTQRLDRELKNLNLENEVYNLGIPGDTTKQLLDRTEEVTRRIYSEADVLIMIQIGANDIQKVGGELRVPPGKFEENLQKIIEKAKKLTNQVVLLGDGYTTIEGSLPWAPEKKVKDERVEKYHLIREKVAKKRKSYISASEKTGRKRNGETISMTEYTPTTRVTKKSEKWSVENLRNRNTRISKPEEFHYHLLTITGENHQKISSINLQKRYNLRPKRSSRDIQVNSPVSLKL